MSTIHTTFKTLIKASNNTPYAVLVGLATMLCLTACVTVVDSVRKDPIEVDKTRRSLGEKIDDKNIRTVVAVNINKADPSLRKSPINVHTFRGVVLLTGQVENKELKVLAGDTARAVPRVRQVHNELELANRQSFFGNVNDSAIETLIDGKLGINKYVDGSKVKVIVENNVVYLLGVMNQEELDAATEVVRKTRGVKRVVRAVEIME